MFIVEVFVVISHTSGSAAVLVCLGREGAEAGGCRRVWDVEVVGSRGARKVGWLGCRDSKSGWDCAGARATVTV